MTAIVLPDIDLNALRRAIPGLAEVDLPSMEEAGKRADEAVDRLLGRSRLPILPILAIAAVVIALSGWALALFSWRRPGSKSIVDATSDDHETVAVRPAAGF
jgi:hypothetical protein